MSERPIRPDQQRELTLRSDQAAALSAELLDLTVRVRSALEAADASADSSVLRAAEIVHLVSHDVSVLTSDMVRHSGTLRGHLYARLLHLTLHEAARTFKSLLGPQLRRAISTQCADPRVDETLLRAHSNAQKLFKTSEKAHGHVRDRISAHREADADQQLRFLREFGELDVAELLFLHFETQQALATPLTRYLEKLAPRSSRAR